MISATVYAMFAVLSCVLLVSGLSSRVAVEFLIRSLPAPGSDTMKAKVYVTLKPSVLDPQGKAIKHSVELLGYNGIDDIRQGKYFEIALDSGLNEDNARTEATRMAREILSNPIIEDFRVEIEK